MSKQERRTETEIILMGLCLCYVLTVGVFAVIRFINEDWVVGTLDVVLSGFGLYIFQYVLRTRQTRYPALSIAFISVLGTIATIVLKGHIQVYWAFPSVALVFYLLPIRQALILWMISALVILYLVRDMPIFQLISFAMTLFVTSFFCHLFSSRMNQQNARLRELANQDVLTLVFNRRAFNQDMEKLENNELLVSGILIDLDNFKHINDFLGHAKGDEVLRTATEVIQTKLGNSDALFRIGGDEFAIISTNQGFKYAYQLAQSIQAHFNESELHGAHAMTLSIAVAEKELKESAQEWLGRLDSALYKAKNSGRDQIVKAIRY